MNVAIRTTSDAFKGNKARTVECARILIELGNDLLKGIVTYPTKDSRIVLCDCDGIKVGTCRI